MANAPQRVRRIVGETLLNLAALAGAVCIVLVILAFTMNISLIMFKTGSMAPTIPAGSLAVVREIPADEIKVGDVVTVDRTDALPVTHRVVSVKGGGSARTIELRGDANDVNDPSPYTVSKVRLVLFSVPGLARVVVWFSNPWLLGALTVTISALVTWAFWPRDPRGPGRGGSSRGRSVPRHAAAPGEAARIGSVTRTAGPSGCAGRRKACGSVLRVVGNASLVASLAAAVLAGPAPPEARAEASEKIMRGEHLTLTSIRDVDAMRQLTPGAPVVWQLGAGVDEAGTESSGAIELELSAHGSSSLGLVLDTRACSERWVGATCPGEDIPSGGQGPVNVDAKRVSLASAPRQLWLRIAASIPEPRHGEVVLSILATAHGENLVVGPGPIEGLPPTGTDSGWALLLGFVAVGVGLVVSSVARGRRRPRS